MGKSVLRLTTRCRDVDEFVRAFARQIDKDSLVVRAENPAAVGVKPAFAIALADGTFVMRGRCDVGPLARGMIRLRFLSLDDAGQIVRDRILGREPEPAGPREALLTVRMAPLFPDETEPEAPAELAPVEVDVFVEDEPGAGPPPVPRPSEPAVFARPDTIRPPVIEGPPADHARVELDAEARRPVHRATTAIAWHGEDRARAFVLIGAAAIAAVLTAIGVVRGDGGDAAPVKATAAIAIPSPPAAAPIVAPAPAPDPIDDHPELDLGIEDDVAICHLVVDADPAGATVTLGDLDLGPSPVEADVPCGSATLTVTAPGHLASSRTVKLVPTTANVRLRPSRALTITTTPPGATVRIDGRALGTTPLDATVRADKRLKLTIDKPGYRRLTQRLAPGGDDAVSLALAKR